MNPDKDLLPQIYILLSRIEGYILGMSESLKIRFDDIDKELIYLNAKNRRKKKEKT